MFVLQKTKKIKPFKFTCYYCKSVLQFNFNCLFETTERILEYHYSETNKIICGFCTLCKNKLTFSNIEGEFNSKLYYQKLNQKPKVVKSFYEIYSPQKQKVQCNGCDCIFYCNNFHIKDNYVPCPFCDFYWNKVEPVKEKFRKSFYKKDCIEIIKRPDPVKETIQKCIHCKYNLKIPNECFYTEDEKVFFDCINCNLQNKIYSTKIQYQHKLFFSKWKKIFNLSLQQIPYLPVYGVFYKNCKRKFDKMKSGSYLT